MGRGGQVGHEIAVVVDQVEVPVGPPLGCHVIEVGLSVAGMGRAVVEQFVGPLLGGVVLVLGLGLAGGFRKIPRDVVEILLQVIDGGCLSQKLDCLSCVLCKS